MFAQSGFLDFHSSVGAATDEWGTVVDVGEGCFKAKVSLFGAKGFGGVDSCGAGGGDGGGEDGCSEDDYGGGYEG